MLPPPVYIGQARKIGKVKNPHNNETSSVREQNKSSITPSFISSLPASQYPKYFLKSVWQKFNYRFRPYASGPCVALLSICSLQVTHPTAPHKISKRLISISHLPSIIYAKNAECPTKSEEERSRALPSQRCRVYANLPQSVRSSRLASIHSSLRD